MVIRVHSPPESPASRSSCSSTASNDHLLRMERSESIRSTDGANGTDKQQKGGIFNIGSNDVERVKVVPARSSGDSDALTLDDLFDENKTAKENKSFLMSYELDRMGMGRYQWCVFFLCGLGFFIDLLWAQATGLILVPIKNEPGFNATNSNIGQLSTAFNAGLTIGAFSWGILVDVIGRRWSFNLTFLISGVFGISSGAAPTWFALRVLAAFIGLGVGGNVPIDATITMEILPTNRRFLLALLSIFQPLGVLVSSGIAYGFIPSYSCGGGASQAANCTKADNMGWRYYLYTLGAITMFIFLIRFVLFNFRESPAYLINRGLDERAIESVSSIARMNKSPPLQFGLQDFREIDKRCRMRNGGTSDNIETESVNPKKETYYQSLVIVLKDTGVQLSRLRVLFKNFTTARITVLLWITFAADFFGFTVASVYLPQILADRGVESNTSLSETYRDYMAIYAPGIAACLLGAFMIELPKFGRQWTMVIASALMAVSLFVYATVKTTAQSVGLNAMEYFMQSLFNSVLYAFVPEAYPSAIRGTASGLTSMFGRVFSIIAPVAADSLYGAGGVNAARNTVFMAGGVTLACPLALALLPYDTKGRRAF